MKLIRTGILFLMGLVCMGCSSVSTNTACKATATDSCLTIEQVDDMTRFADEAIPYARNKTYSTKSNHPRQVGYGRVVQKSNGSSLWVSKSVKGKSWS